MSSSRLDKLTLQGLAKLIGVAIVLLFVIGLILQLAYDPKTDRVGLHPDAVELLLVSFVPIVLATGTGLRDLLLTRSVAVDATPEEAKKKTRGIPIDGDKGTIVFLSLLGPAFGILVVVLLATGRIYLEQGPKWTGFAAAVWGVSTGTVFHQFMKKYATHTQEVKDGAQAAKEPPPSGTPSA